MQRIARPAAAIAAALMCTSLAQAAEAASWTANLRYRHESVDDDAFLRPAEADTLRLRLGWQGVLAGGLSAGVEFEGIAELGDRFDSGANGETSRPLVPDARAAELNQAWLDWRGDRAGLRVGRQRLLLDNQRFVGNAGWRQNEQTFDAVVADFEPADGVDVRLAWLGRVHRVFGDHALAPLARERALDAPLLHVAWTGRAGTLVGYGYWLDDRDLATASTRSLGLRWTGSRTFGGRTLGWSLEAARQRDQGDNPLRVDAGYWLVEPSFAAHGLVWKLGWEHLGGDGSTAFQTPLATGHAFNGWADKFLATPPDGLEDRYASLSGKFGRGRLQDRLAWTVAWHDFRADRGGADYGREWDASLAFPLPGGLAGLVKLADYRSDGFAADARKLWLQLEWSH